MAHLSQEQIQQLFVLVDEYISIQSTQAVKSTSEREALLAMWGEGVEKVFPHKTSVMKVSLQEIAEKKLRDKSA